MSIIKLLSFSLIFLIASCGPRPDTHSDKSNTNVEIANLTSLRTPKTHLHAILRNLKAFGVNSWGASQAEIFDKNLSDVAAPFANLQDAFLPPQSILEKDCSEQEKLSVKEHQLCQALIYEEHNKKESAAGPQDLRPCEPALKAVSAPCILGLKRAQMAISLNVDRMGKIFPPTP